MFDVSLCKQVIQKCSRVMHKFLYHWGIKQKYSRLIFVKLWVFSLRNCDITALHLLKVMIQTVEFNYIKQLWHHTRSGSSGSITMEAMDGFQKVKGILKEKSICVWWNFEGILNLCLTACHQCWTLLQATWPSLWCAGWKVHTLFQ